MTDIRSWWNTRRARRDTRRGVLSKYSDPLVAAFSKNPPECPDCGNTKFQEGPHGGEAVNIRCGKCGSVFNVTAGYARPENPETTHDFYITFPAERVTISREESDALYGKLENAMVSQQRILIPEGVPDDHLCN